MVGLEVGGEGRDVMGPTESQQKSRGKRGY